MALLKSFRNYIEQHRAEIAALQLLYSRPYKQRLTEAMLKDLEAKLKQEPRFGSDPVNQIWRAFELAGGASVSASRGSIKSPARQEPRPTKSAIHRFADLVSLVRFALEQQPVLAPFADTVHERFESWLASKSAYASDLHNPSFLLPPFTADQLAWLHLIRDHIATSLSIEPDDFDYAPFSQRGGLGKAHQLFGDKLPALLDELNTVLAA